MQGPSTARVGDTIRYLSDVSIQSGGNASNVRLTQQLPSGVTFVSASSDRGAGCSGTSTIT
jgi:uncharacterized repeat protein (TIGR01451 family)